MQLTPEALEAHLKQFTGTQQYHRIFECFVVTDGLRFLMEHADCYWLAILFGSHLMSIDVGVHPFTVLTLNKHGQGAEVRIEEGNGGLLASQSLDYTDFPLEHMTLFASWSERFWVGMLPSEY